jgi:hypothetical protein
MYTSKRSIAVISHLRKGNFRISRPQSHLNLLPEGHARENAKIQMAARGFIIQISSLDFGLTTPMSAAHLYWCLGVGGDVTQSVSNSFSIICHASWIMDMLRFCRPIGSDFCWKSMDV